MLRDFPVCTISWQFAMHYTASISTSAFLRGISETRFRTHDQRLWPVVEIKGALKFQLLHAALLAGVLL
jgi:hypothetical protein